MPPPVCVRSRTGVSLCWPFYRSSHKCSGALIPLLELFTPVELHDILQDTQISTHKQTQRQLGVHRLVWDYISCLLKHDIHTHLYTALYYNVWKCISVSTTFYEFVRLIIRIFRVIQPKNNKNNKSGSMRSSRLSHISGAILTAVHPIAPGKCPACFTVQTFYWLWTGVFSHTGVLLFGQYTPSGVSQIKSHTVLVHTKHLHLRAHFHG